MANLVDYVRTHADSFDAAPLNRVDALVFAQLAHMRIPEESPAACTDAGTTLAELGGQANLLGFVATLHDAWGNEELLRAVAASPRFGGITVCRAVDDWSPAAERQFSAVTFLLPQGAFVAMRGTDNTLVGWKENFNMAFCDVVPAQEAARAYLEGVANALKQPVWLGGHSKGGNLALYAATHCDALTRLRLERVYLFDAPGLSSQAQTPSTWADVAPLAERIIPEEAMIGLLWSSGDIEPTVVASSNASIMQHAALSWEIAGDDFKTVKAITYDAYRLAKRFNAWMAAQSGDDRQRFVELLFKLAQATGEVTASGLLASLEKGSLDLVVRRLDGLSTSDQAFFTEELEDLTATLLLGPAPANPQTPTEKAAAAADKIDDLAARFNSTSSKLDKLLGL